MVFTGLRNPHFRLFAGAFLISFSPVFVRLVAVSPTTSAFYRTVIGSVALLLILLIRRAGRAPPRTAWPALAFAAVFFALDLWFWHRSVILIGPGLATLLANLQVFFMIAAGFALFREKPGWIAIVAALLAIVGLSLVLGADWSAPGSGFRRGAILGFLTAMSYAAYMLLLRQSRRDARDPVPLVEVATVSIAVSFLLGAAAVADGSSLAIPTLADFGWLVAYGVLAHALGWMLIASSLTAVTAAEVGIALLLQPTLSLLWDALIFDRRFSGVEILGIVLTLTAIFLGSQRRVS
jgi:drug/metabolite transporter (DMT)-like permease